MEDHSLLENQILFVYDRHVPGWTRLVSLLEFPGPSLRLEGVDCRKFIRLCIVGWIFLNVTHLKYKFVLAKVPLLLGRPSFYRIFFLFWDVEFTVVFLIKVPEMTLRHQILFLLKELDMFSVIKTLFTTEHVYFTNKGQDNQHHDHCQSQKGVRDKIETDQSCQDRYIACQPVFGTN